MSSRQLSIPNHETALVKVDPTVEGWTMHAGERLPAGIQQMVGTVAAAAAEQNRGLKTGAVVESLLSVLGVAHAQDNPNLGLAFEGVLAATAEYLQAQAGGQASYGE